MMRINLFRSVRPTHSIRLHGALVGEAALTALARLPERAIDRPSRVLLDMAAVATLDTSGWAAIVRLYARLSAAGHDVYLACPTEAVRATLRQFGALGAVPEWTAANVNAEAIHDIAIDESIGLPLAA
jgi:anti-anti-sigma regulatory factor